MIRNIVLIAGMTFTLGALGQTPASAPAGATGMCKDGTYHTGPTKSGACSGHKGVKDWYGTTTAKSSGATTPAAVTPSPAPASAAPSTPPTAAAPPSAAKPASPATPSSTSSKSAAQDPSTKVAAAGGGAGQVWVNKKSKVYHCSTDKWYGKTKHGEYMTEAAAKSAGNHSDHGKACT